MKTFLVTLWLMATCAVPAAAQLTPREMRLQTLQADLLAKWDKGKVVPLDSKDLGKIISSITDKGTFPIPEKGTKVDLDSLAEETRTDLNAAIVGLIKAYCSELQTTAVISYMKERDEKLYPVLMRTVRETLQRRLKLTEDDLKAMSDEDVFRLSVGDDSRSHWAGLQPEESSVEVWKTTDKLKQQTMQEFGQEYRAIFSGMSHYNHFFRPKTSIDDELKNNGNVLIANVKLLVRFDNRLNNTPAPYFVRLWFCTVDKKWHPYQLVRSEVGDIPPSESQTVF